MFRCFVGKRISDYVAKVGPLADDRFCSAILDVRAYFGYAKLRGAEFQQSEKEAPNIAILAFF